jgi:RNA polymerase sigma factor (sigma-70 family)
MPRMSILAFTVPQGYRGGRPAALRASPFADGPRVMPETETDFAALLARARQGDAAALEERARRYEPEVRLVAHVQLGPALRPHLDSMDLVQSVHRSLLLGLRAGKFDVGSPDQLVALALTLVRRKVARKWRHLRRQQRLSSGPGGGDLERTLGSLAAPGAGPAQAAQVGDALRHVCAALDGTERRVIALRLEGRSTAEVARALGLDADVLRVRLSRLRRRLRDRGVLDEWL